MCATCHTLYTHALDENGVAIGHVARADAVPGVAAQLVSRHAQLPGVPHAGRWRTGPRLEHDGRARETACCVTRFAAPTSGCCACSIGSAMSSASTTLPQEMERAAADTLAHIEQESATLQLERVMRRRGLGSRRRCSSPIAAATSCRRRTRPGAYGSTSGLPTSRDGPGFESGAVDADRRHRRQRQRRATAQRSSRTMRRSPPRARCRSTRRSWPTPAARVDDRPALRRSLREGQPAAARRFRQDHGATPTSRCTVTLPPIRISAAAAIAFATASRSAPPVLSPFTRSCDISRSATAGRTTSARGQHSRPAASSAITRP